MLQHNQLCRVFSLYSHLPSVTYPPSLMREPSENGKPGRRLVFVSIDDGNVIVFGNEKRSLSGTQISKQPFFAPLLLSESMTSTSLY